jgi:hypothetical protein
LKQTTTQKMEKYAKWNDPANLINPFAPITTFPPCTLYVTGSILLLLRLPFVLVTTLLLFFVTALTSLPLGPLNRLLRYLFEGPLARLLLLLLGYWSVNTNYAAARQLRLRPSKNPDKTRPNPVGNGVQAGDIVVCTATSPIEILWLTWMFRPTFAHVVNTSTPGTDVAQHTAAVQPKGLWSSLYTFCSSQSVPQTCPTDASNAVQVATAAHVKKASLSLKQLADQCKGSMNGSPVCTFPEGVRSNGTGVLMFHPIFHQITFEEHRCHLLTFQHVQQSSSKFSATLPIGSALKCFLWHCMHWSHTMNVTMFPAQELVPPPSIESEAALKSKKEAQVRKELAARASSGKYGGGIAPPIAMPESGALGNRCRNLLAKMYGIDTLTRCSKDYDGFLTFWKNERNGTKKKR